MIIKSFPKPTILVGAGTINEQFLRAFIEKKLPIIAVDGGANYLLERSIQPDYIVGDLDSLNKQESIFDKNKIIKIAEQETTDLEKAVYSFEAPLFLSLGFGGKRMDHTFAAYHILYKYAQDKNILLINEEDISYCTKGLHHLNLPLKTNIAIIPLQPISFEKSEGLAFPLDNLDLELGNLVSTSNFTCKQQVSITPKNNNSPYCIIINHQNLSALNIINLIS